MSSTDHPLLRELRGHPALVYTGESPPREPRYRELRATLPPALRAHLEALDYAQLYTHQASAIDAALSGRDVCVVTSTSSGKTLCFGVPLMASLISEPSARGLLLYPTKALAQDQLGKLTQLDPTGRMLIATYDGDTPNRQRSAIRRQAHVVLTNPDMLHVGILPGHENWVRFFRSLRWIVVDEAHAYRGVFGSHVALILRRLLRLCEHYGSRPQIMACSATIGNPQELFEALTGRYGEVVSEDGAPAGRRTFAFLNPPLDQGKEPSRNLLAGEVLGRAIQARRRALAFCRSRNGVELVYRMVREQIEKQGSDPRVIESYRAGYTPAERRTVEQRFFKGDLLAIVSTNAMEMGVDVGGLDTVILNGYPGSQSSFMQQAGRAGRAGQEGFVVYIAQPDPLEQYLAESPETLLFGQPEHVTINPQNRAILSAQLMCAAHEKPLRPMELDHFGAAALETAESMEGTLEFRSGYFYYPSFEAPAAKVDIRGAGSEQIVLEVDGKPLGTMEYWRALESAHEGAVYLHRGATFRVHQLDLGEGIARLTPQEVDYFTRSMVNGIIEPLHLIREQGFGRFACRLESLRVTREVVGFRRIALDGEQVLDTQDLALPPMTFETIGLRLSLPEKEVDDDPETFMGGVHAAEHALLALAPFFASCDRGDLGSAWYAAMPDTLLPSIIVYDTVPGGIGLCEGLFDVVASWLHGAAGLVARCACDGGCPRCILSPHCSMSNELLSKSAAIQLLRQLAEASEKG